MKINACVLTNKCVKITNHIKPRHFEPYLMYSEINYVSRAIYASQRQCHTRSSNTPMIEIHECVAFNYWHAISDNMNDCLIRKLGKLGGKHNTILQTAIMTCGVSQPQYSELFNLLRSLESRTVYRRLYKSKELVLACSHPWYVHL